MAQMLAMFSDFVTEVITMGVVLSHIVRWEFYWP